MDLPKIIGHRGAAAHAPENTLAGFRKAAAFGLRWVEFDVMLTLDGVAVAHHDHSLERTTGLDQAVAHTLHAHLDGIDAGAWFHDHFEGETIPALGEVLAVLAELGLGANVEIKPAPEREVETADVVVAELKRNWPSQLPLPLISSFQEVCLAVAQDMAADFPRGYLCRHLPRDWEVRARRYECRTVHPDEAHLDAETVSLIRDAGYPVAAYTVNCPAKAVELNAWGVDAIITDDPPAIAEALDASLGALGDRDRNA